MSHRSVVRACPVAVSIGLMLALPACSSEPGRPAGGAGSVAEAGGSGGQGSGGSGSTVQPSTGQAGGSSLAGSSPGEAGSGSGSGGSSGASAAAGSGGSSGASAAAGSGGSGTPSLTTQDFECTEVIGLWVASQWWDSFEKGVDTTHWQFMFQHHGYVELFASPTSEFWGNSVSSKCTTGAEAPDRVVFLPFSLDLSTLEQWLPNLNQVVETMKSKYPSVKRIELMTTLRSPGNMPCESDTDPNTVVPAYVDQAIQMVADASGGLVSVGPKIELTTCDWWAGGTDLTGAGNTGAGQLLAEYYKTH